MIDGFSHMLIVDTAMMGQTREGQPARMSVRVLESVHKATGGDGKFLLDAKEVQQLYEMCAEILAKLAAEALK